MSKAYFVIFFLLAVLSATCCEAAPFIVRQDGEFGMDSSSAAESAEPSMSPEPSNDPTDFGTGAGEPSVSPAPGDGGVDVGEPADSNTMPAEASPDEEEIGEASAEASPEASEQCVDAKYLSEYPRAHLVHTEAVVAEVLCPMHATLPCGTADHVVIVRGKHLSYREYCTVLKCTTARMEVNSVLSHIWDDEQHAGDVKLTMLDARHPAMLQRLLHRFIHTRRSLQSSFR